MSKVTKEVTVKLDDGVSFTVIFQSTDPIEVFEKKLNALYATIKGPTLPSIDIKEKSPKREPIIEKVKTVESETLTQISRSGSTLEDAAWFYEVVSDEKISALKELLIRLRDKRSISMIDTTELKLCGTTQQHIDLISHLWANTKNINTALDSTGQLSIHGYKLEFTL